MTKPKEPKSFEHVFPIVKPKEEEIPPVTKNEFDNRNIYLSCKGLEVNSSFVENPATIIKWIYNNLLSISDSELEFSDAETDLSSWKFAGIINTGNSKQVIEKLLSQCKSRIIHRNDGKIKMIAYSSSRNFTNSGTGTPGNEDIYTYDDSITSNSFDQNPIIKNSFKIDLAPLTELKNEVYINYHKNYATNEFEKCSFIQLIKTNSGVTLSEDLDNSETGVDVSNGGVFRKSLTTGDTNTDWYTDTSADFIADGVKTNDRIWVQYADLSTETLTIDVVKKESLHTTTAFTKNENGVDAEVYFSKFLIDNEDFIINNISGNTITVATRGSGAGSADSHSTNSEIFFLKSFSDDGAGNRDVTREDNSFISFVNYGIINRLEIDADMIRDTTTAKNLRDYYFDLLSERKIIVQFKTTLSAIAVELCDIINIRHPLIENIVSSMSTKKWEVLEKIIYPKDGLIEIKAVEL